MPTIKFFIISCSADAMPEPLFVWGEGDHHSMPTTHDEAEIRVENCREQIGCVVCDAQIHHLSLARSRPAGIPYNEECGRKVGRPKKTS